jgi:signal transduction histidine kinase
MVVMALLVPAVLFSLEAVRRYKDALEDARARLQSDVEVASQHALGVFDTTHVLLERSIDLIGNSDDLALRAREEELHGQLKSLTAPFPYLQSMWVFNREGTPLASNRFFPIPTLNVSDREYFQWHLAGRGTTFVTEALVARIGGDRFFDVSRRRVDSSGSFAGLVSVGLRPEHFATFYKDLAGQRPDARVVLFRSDGRYVARWPSLPPPGARLPTGDPLVARWYSGETSGNYDGKAFLDGSERLGAFRKVGGYPLYVYASVPRDAVVTRWLNEMGLLAAFVAPVSLLLAWMAWVARQRTREQLLAMERLEHETANRLRVEASLRQVQKLEAMGRLTGGVAHDFNNLLAVLGNNVFLLKTGSIQGEAKDKAFARMERAVESGSSLTRQLLSFTRSQALLPEVTSLQDRLPALADMLQAALGSRIKCVVSVAPDTALIKVDFAELELALLNLAVNAKDASPDGGSVTITARNALPHELPDNATHAVVIEFADTGNGIHPEVIERVFEPFFTTKPVGDGTGLGLSQVHGFCTRANGVASIYSELGEGTMVRMSLPAAAAAAEPVVHAPDAPPLALQCRVLLVDDNVALADSIRPVLEATGCTVAVAPSVKHALAELARGPAFDVVLSDIVMPGSTDGIQFAQALRHTDPELPVVLMTGYSAQLDSARELGFPVLPKPCTPQVLVEALARAVQRGTTPG